MIEGSVVSYFANAGANTISLPKKGLNIVGFIVSNQAMSITIRPGKVAWFPGSPSGTYIFQPVDFTSDDGEINISLSGAEVVVITYYGKPAAGTPKLDAYAGIRITGSLTITASTSTRSLFSADITADFPAGATKITGFEYSIPNPPTGVDMSLSYLSFGTSTGQSINLGMPASQDSPFIPDYPTMTGILPLNLPIATTFGTTLSTYATNSNSSNSTVGVYQIVLYYA